MKKERESSIELREELQRIQREHDGLLRPADVVRDAEPETSPLHEYFEWDDGKAAEQYRLDQARALIRVCVTILPSDEQEGGVRVRLFHTLKDELKNGGGYRAITEILNDEGMRARLIQDALSDLLHFKEKYKAITEIAKTVGRLEKQLRLALPKDQKKKAESDDGKLAAG